MELRHLRYFIAVAEAGSMKLAAESRLHTAQPSLSRQMRDLEQEVGAALFVRSVRGVELTAAGRAFLDHARLALTQAEAAVEAARRAARPAKAIFAVGFLTGQEAAWLAPATRILSDELPNIEIRVSSGFSVTLAEDLKQGRVDIAFLRHEPDPDLAFKLVLKEPRSPSSCVTSDSRRIRPSIRAISRPRRSLAYPRFPASCAARSTLISNGRELRSRPVSRSTISPWRFPW